VSITIGARKPRELPVEGRDLDGIYLAMQYLEQSNRAVRGDQMPADERISAAGKHVIVIGGGDTGSDCIGTANRQEAASITQIELLPASPQERPPHEPWPVFARLYKTTSSHKEGCERLFNISTKKFTGENGRVTHLHAAHVEWDAGNNGHPKMREVPGSDFVLQADLVLLAMGFEHVVQTGLVGDLGLSLNSRGNIAVDQNRMTNVPGVFAAGDAARGASLIVWAIMEGRAAAKGIHTYLSR
jgi:glutamate synthase (NADPH/NADH) small chain